MKQRKRPCFLGLSPVVTFLLFLSEFGVTAAFKFSLLENGTSDLSVDERDAATDEDSEDQEDEDAEDMDDFNLPDAGVPEESLETWGHYGDLTVAFPLAMQNLSNFTGLISGKEIGGDNITWHFGNPEEDKKMLHDKVAGFFTVLHESMEAQDGPLHCPRNSMRHIKECIVIATCLVQSQVPEYVEMPMYASMVELMDRFLAEGWPVIEVGILEESHEGVTPDTPVPDKYQCDAFSHSKPFIANLQLSEDARSALAMSALLAQKAQSTHELLDSHRHNMSLEVTISKVMDLWRPICLQAKVFSCDEFNWWDIHYASHQQTMALMQTGAAAAVRAEIRTRLRLERRVKAFMREHRQTFGSFFQRSFEGNTVGAYVDYFNYHKKSTVSTQIWKKYGRAGKEAISRFVMPYSRSVAAINTTRAVVWFDQVEFGKFQKDRQLREEEDEEDEEDEEEDVEEIEEDRPKLKSSRALLSLRESEELDDELDDSNSLEGRRRKKKSDSRRRSPDRRRRKKKSDSRRRSSDSSKRRRRRRRKRKGGFGKKLKKGVKKAGKKAGKVAKKAGKAISKAVKVIEAFITALFGCIGDVFEFITVGYEGDVVPGVSMAAGLSLGAFGELIWKPIKLAKDKKFKAWAQGFEELLLKGKAPATWISVDIGFSAGPSGKVAGGGVGTGIGLSCGMSSCVAYLAVGVMATVNIPFLSPACIWGPGPLSNGWTCSQVFGGSISAFCCNLNAKTGKNDCR